MATRHETQNKRRKMRDAIIEACRTGTVQQGEVIPPLRVLAKEYGLSVDLTREVVQSLVAEGILYARQGAGIFAGHPSPVKSGTFLFLLPEYVVPLERGVDLF